MVKMKHIFVVHSSIANIVQYDIIKSLVSQNEDVLILRDRGHKFIADFDVESIDISSYKVRSLKNINYFAYKLKVKRLVKKLTHNPFILYTPHSFDEIFMGMIKSKNCFGYYYVEEGDLSYFEINRFDSANDGKNVKNNIIKLLGATRRFYYINNKFKGTIAISERAFPWNTSNKIITQVNEFFNLKCFDTPVFPGIIVWGYLEEDSASLYKLVDVVYDYLTEHHIQSVAMKFHPQSYIFKRNMIDKIIDYVSKKGVNTELLDRNFMIEQNIFKTSTSLFSMGYSSSLVIYSLLFGGKAFKVSKSGVMHFSNLDAYFEYYNHQH